MSTKHTRRGFLSGKTDVPIHTSPFIMGTSHRNDAGNIDEIVALGAFGTMELNIETEATANTTNVEVVITDTASSLSDIVSAVNTFVQTNFSSPYPLVAEEREGCFYVQTNTSGEGTYIRINPSTGAHPSIAQYLGLPEYPHPKATVRAGEVRTSSVRALTQGNRSGTTFIAQGEDRVDEAYNRALTSLAVNADSSESMLDRAIAVEVTIKLNAITNATRLLIDSSTNTIYGIYLGGGTGDSYDSLLENKRVYIGAYDNQTSVGDLNLVFVITDFEGKEIVEANGPVRVVGAIAGPTFNALSVPTAASMADAPTPTIADSSVPNDGGNVLGVDTPRPNCTNLTISNIEDRSVIVVNSAAFQTNGVRVGDKVVITGTNNIPYSSDGNYLVDQVLSETRLIVRPFSYSDQKILNENTPIQGTISVSTSGLFIQGCTLLLSEPIQLPLLGIPEIKVSFPVEYPTGDLPEDALLDDNPRLVPAWVLINLWKEKSLGGAYRGTSIKRGAGYFIDSNRRPTEIHVNQLHNDAYNVSIGQTFRRTLGLCNILTGNVLETPITNPLTQADVGRAVLFTTGQPSVPLESTLLDGEWGIITYLHDARHAQIQKVSRYSHPLPATSNIKVDIYEDVVPSVPAAMLSVSYSTFQSREQLNPKTPLEDGPTPAGFMHITEAPSGGRDTSTTLGDTFMRSPRNIISSWERVPLTFPKKAKNAFAPTVDIKVGTSPETVILDVRYEYLKAAGYVGTEFHIAPNLMLRIWNGVNVGMYLITSMRETGNRTEVRLENLDGTPFIQSANTAHRPVGCLYVSKMSHSNANVIRMSNMSPNSSREYYYSGLAVHADGINGPMLDAFGIVSNIRGRGSSFLATSAQSVETIPGDPTSHSVYWGMGQVGALYQGIAGPMVTCLDVVGVGIRNAASQNFVHWAEVSGSSSTVRGVPVVKARGITYNSDFKNLSPAVGRLDVSKSPTALFVNEGSDAAIVGITSGVEDPITSGRRSPSFSSIGHSTAILIKEDPYNKSGIDSALAVFGSIYQALATPSEGSDIHSTATTAGGGIYTVYGTVSGRFLYPQSRFNTVNNQDKVSNLAISGKVGNYSYKLGSAPIPLIIPASTQRAHILEQNFDMFNHEHGAILRILPESLHRVNYRISDPEEMVGMGVLLYAQDPNAPGANLTDLITTYFGGFRAGPLLGGTQEGSFPASGDVRLSATTIPKIKAIAERQDKITGAREIYCSIGLGGQALSNTFHGMHLSLALISHRWDRARVDIADYMEIGTELYSQDPLGGYSSATAASASSTTEQAHRRPVLTHQRLLDLTKASAHRAFTTDSDPLHNTFIAPQAIENVYLPRIGGLHAFNEASDDIIGKPVWDLSEWRADVEWSSSTGSGVIESEIRENLQVNSGFTSPRSLETLTAEGFKRSDILISHTGTGKYSYVGPDGLNQGKRLFLNTGTPALHFKGGGRKTVFYLRDGARAGATFSVDLKVDLNKIAATHGLNVIFYVAHTKLDGNKSFNVSLIGADGLLLDTTTESASYAPNTPLRDRPYKKIKVTFNRWMLNAVHRINNGGGNPHADAGTQLSIRIGFSITDQLQDYTGHTAGLDAHYLAGPKVAPNVVDAVYLYSAFYTTEVDQAYIKGGLDVDGAVRAKSLRYLQTVDGFQTIGPAEAQLLQNSEYGNQYKPKNYSTYRKSGTVPNSRGSLWKDALDSGAYSATIDYGGNSISRQRVGSNEGHDVGLLPMWYAVFITGKMLSSEHSYGINVGLQDCFYWSGRLENTSYNPSLPDKDALSDLNESGRRNVPLESSWFNNSGQSYMMGFSDVQFMTVGPTESAVDGTLHNACFRDIEFSGLPVANLFQDTVGRELGTSEFGGRSNPEIEFDRDLEGISYQTSPGLVNEGGSEQSFTISGGLYVRRYGPWTFTRWYRPIFDRNTYYRSGSHSAAIHVFHPYFDPLFYWMYAAVGVNYQRSLNDKVWWNADTGNEDQSGVDSYASRMNSRDPDSYNADYYRNTVGDWFIRGDQYGSYIVYKPDTPPEESVGGHEISNRRATGDWLYSRVNDGALVLPNRTGFIIPVDPPHGSTLDEMVSLVSLRPCVTRRMEQFDQGKRANGQSVSAGGGRPHDTRIDVDFQVWHSMPIDPGDPFEVATENFGKDWAKKSAWDDNEGYIIRVWRHSPLDTGFARRSRTSVDKVFQGFGECIYEKKVDLSTIDEDDLIATGANTSASSGGINQLVGQYGHPSSDFNPEDNYAHIDEYESKVTIDFTADAGSPAKYDTTSPFRVDRSTYSYFVTIEFYAGARRVFLGEDYHPSPYRGRAFYLCPGLDWSRENDESHRHTPFMWTPAFPNKRPTQMSRLGNLMQRERNNFTLLGNPQHSVFNKNLPSRAYEQATRWEGLWTPYPSVAGVSRRYYPQSFTFGQYSNRGGWKDNPSNVRFYGAQRTSGVVDADVAAVSSAYRNWPTNTGIIYGGDDYSPWDMGIFGFAGMDKNSYLGLSPATGADVTRDSTGLPTNGQFPVSAHTWKACFTDTKVPDDTIWHPVVKFRGLRLKWKTDRGGNGGWG